MIGGLRRIIGMTVFFAVLCLCYAQTSRSPLPVASQRFIQWSKQTRADLRSVEVKLRAGVSGRELQQILPQPVQIELKILSQPKSQTLKLETVRFSEVSQLNKKTIRESVESVRRISQLLLALESSVFINPETRWVNLEGKIVLSVRDGQQRLRAQFSPEDAQQLDTKVLLRLIAEFAEPVQEDEVAFAMR